MKVNIKTLIDDVQCYETVRELRWPKIRECPFCDSINTIKRGYDDRKFAKQRYLCHENKRMFVRNYKRDEGRPFDFAFLGSDIKPPQAA